MDVPFRISSNPTVQERQADWLRDNLSLADQIGLAMRAVRRGRRESQREYAAARGWSPAHQARLETRATDLRLGQVLSALEPTAFGLVLARERPASWPDPGASVDDVAGWVSDVMNRSALSTRTAAFRCGVSQSTVNRVGDARRAASVRLGLVVAVVEGLGGEVHLGMSHARFGIVATSPQSWPTGAVLPRARGNGRRLAAHGWVRRGRPWWHRWGDRPHLGAPPVWTAESPSEPRWEREPYGNGIMPAPKQRDPGETGVA